MELEPGGEESNSKLDIFLDVKSNLELKSPRREKNQMLDLFFSYSTKNNHIFFSKKDVKVKKLKISFFSKKSCFDSKIQIDLKILKLLTRKNLTKIVNLRLKKIEFFSIYTKNLSRKKCQFLEKKIEFMKFLKYNNEEIEKFFK